MIKRLKTKFMILTTAALFVLLSFIVCGMNIINYHSLISNADLNIEMISQRYSDAAHAEPQQQSSPTKISRESSYFVVFIDNEGKAINVEACKSFSMSEEEAFRYANSVLKTGKAKGFSGRFRFGTSQMGDISYITFLDCSDRINAFNSSLFSSISISIVGFAVSLIVVYFFSEAIIHPVAQSYNKQKRFITDAGHEIKTPLTIINANADILEMEVGKSESLDDIKAQTKRLSELTNDLIYLARMEEECTLLSMTDVPVSEIIKDTVSQFKAPAMTMGKTITLEAPPELFVRANAQALQHLISILIDNALKYSPDGSNVFLSVEKAGKHTRISVSNEALPDIRREDIDLFFERFYRADFSRNSATGGHGIGLSIAQAIVNAHGGKISAALKDDNVFCVTVSLG